MKGKYEITSETINVSFENSNGKIDFVRIEISYNKQGLSNYSSVYLGGEKVLGIADELSKEDVIKLAMKYILVLESF